ncbi:antibiotic biosynthesis monooxygenase [Pseudonocardiaceae bacterium YIM PH 21723]|nr:antibiotic biosynthesis monooxygenase [Pseudonocardiaceae bacterium YIM PH 21723]
MNAQETIITVTADTDQVTLVNVFTVTPPRQDDLVAALEKGVAEFFQSVPGFISATLHASLDGTRVINYAQWSSEQAFQDAMRRPEIQAYIATTAKLAENWDPTLTRVLSIHHHQPKA